MIGRKIGQYKITKFIANGGMADVYQAHDEGLDRDVALKILFPQYSRDEEFTKRFRREARAAASMRHPNIVQVYATGVTEPGDHYIAMEFVPDGTLEDINSRLGKEGELIEVGLVLRMMEQIADALREAHMSGIVHRDLKPSNILLRSDNSPVLTDLGIALSGNTPRLTQTNKMMGTPDYMSPEQAQGGDLDGRSDIYSFGIMLYELLCGRRPFGNESPWMIIHKQINEEPKPLVDVRGGLNPLVYQIVHRCMAKNPDMRFQSAAELSLALKDAITASGADGDQSNSWKTVTLDSAGVRPPTGGTVLQQAAGSSVFPLSSPLTPNPISGPQSGPHSNPNLRKSGSSFPWGIGIAILAVVLAIGGLVGWLITSIDRGPLPTVVSQVTNTPIAVVIAEESEATEEAAELEIEEEEEISNLSEPVIEPTQTEAPEPTLSSTQVVTQIIQVITSVPTETPLPTNTPTATPTETPSPTPTVPAEPTQGDGLPIRFENDDGWTVDNPENGSIIKSDELVFAGDFAGRIDYAFNTAESDTLTALQINPISGRPDTIGLRLYGDGSGLLAYALLVDANQQSWLIPMGPINHTDRWAFMSGSLGPNNRVRLNGSDSSLDFPVVFHGFQITDPEDTFEGSGTIYIDELSAFSTNVAATATPTPASSGETETATPDAATGRNVTITLSPGLRCDDGPHDLAHDRTMTFKWESNLNPSDLQPGDRFILTISGGGGSSGRAFDFSLSNTPGEWLVNIQPGEFGIANGEDYEWSVQFTDINGQIIARSDRGCFNT